MVMNEEFYLVLRKKDRGWGLAARITQRRPKLDSSEICMQLTVSVPDQLFKKPTITAAIKIDDVPPRTEISAEVLGSISDIVQSQLGVRVEFSQVPPAAEEDPA